MKDFKKLEIWQLGMTIANRVFEVFEEIPWQTSMKLKDQATSAAVSIPSNIAEGNSRKSEKDKYRFQEIALGSAFELQTQLLLVQMCNWLPQDRLTELLSDIELEQKKLQAFMASLNP